MNSDRFEALHVRSSRQSTDLEPVRINFVEYTSYIIHTTFLSVTINIEYHVSPYYTCERANKKPNHAVFGHINDISAENKTIERFE